MLIETRLNCWRRLVIQSPEKKGSIVKPRASELKLDPAAGMSAIRLGSVVRRVHMGTLAFKQIRLESPDEAHVPRARRQSLEKEQQGVPAMKRRPLRHRRHVRGKQLLMKKTSSYRHRADRSRPASRGPPSPLPPAQGRSAGHRLSCCRPRHPLSARRRSF